MTKRANMTPAQKAEDNWKKAQRKRKKRIALREAGGQSMASYRSPKTASTKEVADARRKRLTRRRLMWLATRATDEKEFRRWVADAGLVGGTDEPK